MSFTRYLACRRGASSLLAAVFLTLPPIRPGTPERQASTVITGRVTDSGGQLLGAATVSISARKLAAVTASDGRYTLTVARAARRSRQRCGWLPCRFHPHGGARSRTGEQESRWETMNVSGKG